MNGVINSKALKYVQMGDEKADISLVFLHGSTMTKEISDLMVFNAYNRLELLWFIYWKGE